MSANAGVGLTKRFEEVKDFYANLGVEYRYSCYSEKNSEGCHLLADYLDTIEREYEKAARIYKQNCFENNYAHSCFSYGKALFYGRGIESDEKEAMIAFEKGCDLGFGGACFNAGQINIGAEPKARDIIKPDVKKGVTQLEKGCDLKDGKSCFTASCQYLFGKNGVEKNLQKAFKLAFKGCELDELRSCGNLSQMYERGDGVEKDLVKAQFYKKKVLDTFDEIKQKNNFSMEMYTDEVTFLDRIRKWFGISS
ncbi:Sel1 repeat-containing protein 1-like protein [Dinothrombium tinctorium]|uniref:Sel1 repeat-containing protein 1-like protein n=1 Tax=Dinothrombium tinctorium TaxID=1965070 RepID=A0A3S3PM57_9ACAR|nr:Sel1 repeat-containing protein 1-like protein [Dinothrombium tinctorium]